MHMLLKSVPRTGENTQLSSVLSVSLFCFCLLVISGSHIATILVCLFVFLVFMFLIYLQLCILQNLIALFVSE